MFEYDCEWDDEDGLPKINALAKDGWSVIGVVPDGRRGTKFILERETRESRGVFNEPAPE